MKFCRKHNVPQRAWLDGRAVGCESRPERGLADSFLRMIALGRYAARAERFHMGHSIVKVTALAAAMTFAMASAQATPNIDGNVGGVGDDYSHAYALQFDIENGASGVEGAELLMDLTDRKLSVGLKLGANFADNTFGSTAAADWDPIKRFYEKMSGSETWAFSNLGFNDESIPNIAISFNYFERDGGKNPELTHQSFIESLSIAGIGSGALIDKGVVSTSLTSEQQELVGNLFQFDTSLAYNYQHASQYFATRAECGTIEQGQKSEQICSPVNLNNNPYDPENSEDPNQLFDGDGNYNYDFELVDDEEWIPEIMYEYSIDLTVLSSLLATAGHDTTALDEFGADNFHDYAKQSGLIHLSPMKLAGDGTLYSTDWPTCPNGSAIPENGSPCSTTPGAPPPLEVPEPGTLTVFGLGLTGLAVMRRRRKLAGAAK